MTTSPSLWNYIIDAGFVVKCVMLILFAASIASWSVIIERRQFYKKQWQNAKAFQARFWSGADLNNLYQEVSQEDLDDHANSGLEEVFVAGFQTFSKLKAMGNYPKEDITQDTERAMLIAENKTRNELEKPLSLLATIGSVSPFVGIFGTVWGIMTAFQALGTAQQASIAMVAPGISEALLTTAFGLFAAVPAVIAFNRFTQQVERLQSNTESFSSELINILHRALSK